MNRGMLTYIFMLLSGISMLAGNPECAQPKVTFGAEWGYMPSFFAAHHYNFFDPDGFRVDDKGASFSYFTNGEVTLHVGYNFNERWNLSFHAGYSGAAGFQPVIPLSLRATRFWGDNHMTDRWFTFLDLGSGLCIKDNPQGIISSKAGAGYRISLSRHTKLDFIAALKGLYTHPDIVHYGEIIGREWTNRNDGYACSIFLGVAITF